MTVRGRFSLDTNILVYAVDLDAGDRHEWSRTLVGRAARCDCVLTVQALAEFFHATTRKNLLPLSRAGVIVRAWLEVFPVTSARHLGPRRCHGCGGRASAIVLGRDALGHRSAVRLLGDPQRRHAGWPAAGRRRDCQSVPSGIRSPPRSAAGAVRQERLRQWSGCRSRHGFSFPDGAFEGGATHLTPSWTSV